MTRVDHEKPLVVEEWTWKVTSVGKDGKELKFSVSGSVTGADGEGSTAMPFTSSSGRVKIDPASYFRSGGAKVPVGYQVKWKVLPMVTDEFAPPADLGDPSLEHAVTLAQGLPNGKHTLELIAADGDGIAVKAIRSYLPPSK